MVPSGLPHLMLSKVSWAEGREEVDWVEVSKRGIGHCSCEELPGLQEGRPTVLLLVAQRQYGDNVQASIIISFCFPGDIESLGSDENSNTETVQAKTNTSAGKTEPEASHCLVVSGLELSVGSG